MSVYQIIRKEGKGKDPKESKSAPWPRTPGPPELSGNHKEEKREEEKLEKCP